VSGLLLGLLPASSVSRTLLVSHYNGNPYTLTLNGGKLSVTSLVKACGQTPAWLGVRLASWEAWSPTSTSAPPVGTPGRVGQEDGLSAFI
jgi:hypothetical protein